jgi:uncharacterized protein (TIGR02996 family)
MFDDIRYRLPYLVNDPSRDPQETAFLKSILENPDDDASRLIFADWLEENAMTDKAAFVRLEVEMSRLSSMAARYDDIRQDLLRLDESIGGEWSAALVRPGRLLNCGKSKSDDLRIRFSFECPKLWADLNETPDPQIRHCGGCRKKVHFCSSKDEAEQHALKGHCIAVSSQVALGVREKYPLSEVEMLTTVGIVTGEVMPDEAFADPDSPYYRWAEEFFARRGKGKSWWRV